MKHLKIYMAQNSDKIRVRRALCAMFLFIVLFFPALLSAETPQDSLSTEQPEIKNKSATLFIVKGTLVTNLDQVKGNVSINEAKAAKKENNQSSQKTFSLAKDVEKEETAHVAEQKTEDINVSQTNILPAGQSGKSLLGGGKKHAVAIAVSSAKNEHKTHINSSFLHNDFYTHSLDIYYLKNDTYNSFFFFLKNELLNFTQGIRPPPMTI